ncbi:Ig-like domain repeat protein [uncultured Methanobrevibacter sp.]|uniref:Ig-like domain repeat protein n=1 Tax=uncultured Methanobrevibacter sp. TaxID=253161 RepID=UPI0025E04697|nr:hypothetical protein [uncultured Methanobrevibacter sp.]
MVLKNIEPGDYNIAMVYDGDNTYGPAVVTGSFSVDKLASDLNVTVPSDVKAGENAVIDVVIPGASGNVSVVVNGVDTVVALDENGTAQLVLKDIVPGDYSVAVVYDGDNTYSSAVVTGSFSVDKLASDVNVTVPSDVKAGEWC